MYSAAINAIAAMAALIARSIRAGWSSKKLPLTITLYKTVRTSVINAPKR